MTEEKFQEMANDVEKLKLIRAEIAILERQLDCIKFNDGEGAKATNTRSYYTAPYFNIRNDRGTVTLELPTDKNSQTMLSTMFQTVIQIRLNDLNRVLKEYEYSTNVPVDGFPVAPKLWQSVKKANSDDWYCYTKNGWELRAHLTNQQLEERAEWLRKHNLEGVEW